MNRLIFIVRILTVLFVTACSPPIPPAATKAPAVPPTATTLPSPIIETPSPTPEPSAAAAPTETPTETPAPTDTPATATVSFAKDVMPILKNRCLKCHGGEETKEGLSVASYEALMAGSQNGPVVIPGDPDNSLLVQQLLNGKMPKRGPKLTPDQIQIIIEWVRMGAPNN